MRLCINFRLNHTFIVAEAAAIDCLAKVEDHYNLEPGGKTLFD